MSSTAGKVEFFAGNSATSILDFATNASQITIGGQGGSTRIRNQLVVDSTSRFNADVTLCGGFASYSFTVASRAQAGSNRIAHPTGILGNNLFNSNVDLIDVNRFVSGDPQYNEVDTSGSGNWGGTSYQDAITNIGGNPAIEPQDLPELTGNQYYLPLLRESLDENGVPYFQENDILLIDSPDSSVSSVSETNFSGYTDGNAPQGIIAEVLVVLTLHSVDLELDQLVDLILVKSILLSILLVDLTTLDQDMLHLLHLMLHLKQLVL